MNALHIDFTRRDGEPCWALHGEMDIANYTELRTDEILDTAADAPCIHLDLTRLTYMDSSGLRQILSLSRTAASRGIQLFVHVRPGSLVERVIRQVGAMDLINVVHEPDSDGASELAGQ